MWVCPVCGARVDVAGRCDRDGVERADAAHDPLLGATIGSFRVARAIGAGAMGRVYLAVQPSIGGRVAIKLLAEGSDTSAVDRFFAEARAVNRIRHEHVVDVLDMGTFAGRPFIVMEHLDGAPLSRVLARKPVPLGGLLQVVREILDAVGAAHEVGIVHRDLKPDNVFVTPGGHAKVLDFGIAKIGGGEAGVTQTGALVGTPRYMSPEQALGRACDGRADIYSAGVILYEGCVGELPFSGGSTFDLLRRHVEQPPAPPRSKRPDLPPRLEAVILRALAKDPSARFATAGDMARALDEIARALPGPEQIGLSVDGSATRAPVAALRPGLASSSAPDAMATAPAVLHDRSAPTITEPLEVAASHAPASSHHAPPRTEPPPSRVGKPILVALGGLIVVAAAVGIGVLVSSRGLVGRRSDRPTLIANHLPAHEEHAPKQEPPAPKLPSTAGYAIVRQEVVMMADAPAADRPTPTSFDVAAYLPRARARMNTLLPHAELWMLTAAANEHGVVDLSSMAVVYFFRDANDDGQSTAMRPCMGTMTVSGIALVTVLMSHDDCSMRLLPKPRCTLAAATARAFKLGLPKGRVQMSLMDGAGAGPQWFVTSMSGSTQAFADDCE